MKPLIDIKISPQSLRRYTDVAMLVDRPDFINIYEELHTYLSYDHADEEMDIQKWAMQTKLSKSDFEYVNFWRRKFINQFTDFDQNYSSDQLDQLLSDISRDICLLLGFSFNYQRVIRAALVKSEITEDDYPDVEIAIINDEHQNSVVVVDACPALDVEVRTTMRGLGTKVALVLLTGKGGKTVRGLHKPLITPQLWQKCQEVQYGRTNNTVNKRLYDNPDFTLRRFAQCALCGSPLTVCWSTGKLGKKYPYY